jgi:hypothetical protein
MAGLLPVRRLSGSGDDVSRRRIFKGIAGAAAASAGGVMLAEAVTSSASAAPQGTTVEPGAVAPAVANLADAATVTLDASLGNDFRLIIAGNRTMSTPANPTDGQKITLQVTQGTGGSFTLSWSSGYEFSAGLPQPALSISAGQTDLLCFIYNAAKGKWLLAAFVSGFSSPPPVTQPPGTYRLFPATDGPSSPVPYSGPFICGVVAAVTTGGCWLDGYWWWVCPSGQSTAPQKFALWCLYDTSSGALVANSTVTSGTLTAGQWNYVPLATPVPLAIDATYVAATGFTGSFPNTNSQFGSGDPYAAGIVSGPLTAYSDGTGTNPSPFHTPQAVFSVAGTDPTTTMPIYGSSTCNFWMDVQVTTSPPAGTSYRMWPSYPRVPGQLDSEAHGYTVATEFQLSQACTLDDIWFYSVSGAGALPTRCAIWNVSTQSVVAGTDITSPAWSGPAGSGWVSRAYTGVTLPAGDYKVAVYYGGGSQWYMATTGYWSTGGPGAKGISSGPLTAPGTATASSPGQSTYNAGSWGYPQTYAAAGAGENLWVDVEVTPTS